MPERTGLGGLKLDTPLPADSVGAKGLLTIAFFVAGAQTAAALKQAAIVGVAGTIVDVRARALTGPTGAALIADVNKNGTTIFSTQGNRPTIADGATVSSTTLPDVTSVAAGDYLSLDVDQIGSGVAGSNLLVSVTIKVALID
jgi:hypothetical protein